MKKLSSPDPARSLIEAHGRDFEGNRYVYPVLSRRSGGISIGVNLNRDKVCDFNCIYCQVDRSRPGKEQPGRAQAVDLDRLREELDALVQRVTSGQIYRETRFRDTPEPLRRLKDIALSGDGEPTTCGNFPEAVDVCAEVRRRHRLDDVKLVLLTNASMFHRANVRRALEVLDANHGEIWAKLDAGTEAHYRQVARTDVAWQQILDNLHTAAMARPIVIQSLFMRIHGEPPEREEQLAYCRCLREITSAGGRIKLVQVHTVARPPAESWVTPLSNAEVDAVANLVREETGLTVVGYYGTASRE
jgi:wyosine [tRNA(Phe)-imidazoG37] synthetase (radical SAM superfamily)